MGLESKEVMGEVFNECSKKLVLTGIASILAGSAKGFYDARETPLSEPVGELLKYLPTAVHATIGLTVGFVISKSIEDGVMLSARKPSKVFKLLGSVAVGTLGGALGALETGVGYFIGYGLGAYTK